MEGSDAKPSQPDTPEAKPPETTLERATPEADKPAGSDASSGASSGASPQAKPGEAKDRPGPGPRPVWMERRERPLPANPRRVRGGIKLSTKDEDPTGWLPERWLRLLEAGIDSERLVEGRGYAVGGQTRRLEITPGKVVASVQGRTQRPYRTTMTFETMDHRAWDRVVATMVDQAVYVAKLMAGEVPANIEDVFHPVGKRLFPLAPGEIRVGCQCTEFRDDASRWCKHIACVGYLIADKLASDPLAIFMLRGMPKEQLTELLRQRRTAIGSVHGAAVVYVSHIPGVTDMTAPALDADPESFWEIGPEIDRVSVPIEKPEVSKPLLRRLGPSPFEQARFPLVGLLATIYDVVSGEAIEHETPRSKGDLAEPAPEEPAPEPDDSPKPRPALPKPLQPKKRRAKAIKKDPNA